MAKKRCNKCEVGCVISGGRTPCGRLENRRDLRSGGEVQTGVEIVSADEGFVRLREIRQQQIASGGQVVTS